MQNTGLRPLEGVYCCSREKPALGLEATGLSANRGPEAGRWAKPTAGFWNLYMAKPGLRAWYHIQTGKHREHT